MLKSQIIVLCTLRLYYYTVAKENVPTGFPLSGTSGPSVPRETVGFEYAYPLSLRSSLWNLMRQILSKVCYKFLMSEREPISHKIITSDDVGKLLL